MKAKVDERGNLWLERGGDLKEQACPYNKDDASCGDWCPLFEIDEYKDEDTNGKVIRLCQSLRVILLEDFTDERIIKQGEKN